MSSIINLRAIHAIIFDLGGVVLNLNYDLTINAFKKLGGDQFEELYAKSRQDRFFDLYETGEIDTQKFLSYLNQFLPGVEQAQIIEAWNSMLLDLPHERIDLLLNLKKTHQIFLLSNTNEIHYQEFTAAIKKDYGAPEYLNSVFHKTYFSHLEKKRKPNANAFNLVLDNHKLDSRRTLFIDDSIQHIEGAKKVGLQTYHLVNEDIIDIFD